MKNRSHRYDINRPRSKHKHKHSTYKKDLTMMIFICIKQHMRLNFKKTLLIEKACSCFFRHTFLLWIEPHHFMQEKKQMVLGSMSKSCSVIKAVNWMCSARKVFLKILQYSRKNVCRGVSLLIELKAVVRFWC